VKNVKYLCISILLVLFSIFTYLKPVFMVSQLNDIYLTLIRTNEKNIMSAGSEVRIARVLLNDTQIVTWDQFEKSDGWIEDGELLASYEQNIQATASIKLKDVSKIQIEFIKQKGSGFLAIYNGGHLVDQLDLYSNTDWEKEVWNYDIPTVFNPLVRIDIILELLIIFFFALKMACKIFLSNQNHAKSNKKVQNKARISKLMSFFVILLFLILGFYKNIYHSSEYALFDTWQADSEDLVFGRIVNSENYGFFSNSGLLIKSSSQDAKTCYLTNKPLENYEIYNSQIGLQGHFFSLLNSILPTSNLIKTQLYYLINCILLILVIYGLYNWIFKELGPTSAFFVILSFILNSWITMGARNMYWVIWTLLFPMMGVALILQKGDIKNHKYKVYLFTFISVFIRAACGFEFISTVLISIELPIIYYAIKNKYKLKLFLETVIRIGISGLIGFLVALIINLYQKANYMGNLSVAALSLKNNIAYRTGLFKGNYDEIIEKSLNIPLQNVIKIYFKEGNSIILGYPMISLIVLLIIFTIILFVMKYLHKIDTKQYRSLFAFNIMTWISLSAPLSWIVLAKAHSYVHQHINYILWSIPCVFLIFAFVGAMLKELFSLYTKIVPLKAKNIYLTVLLSIILCSALQIFAGIFSWSNNLHSLESAVKNGNTLVENNDLLIVEDSGYLYCRQSKNYGSKDRYFLHIYEENNDAFLNFDFYFDDKKIAIPIWENFKLAKIKITNKNISKIEIGQYNQFGRPWEKTITYPLSANIN